MLEFQYVERGLFDTLETKRKLYKVNFRRDFWDRLLRRAVSYWRIFPSQKSLQRLTRSSFLLVSKVANILISYFSNQVL